MAARGVPIVQDAKQSTIWLGALLAMFILYLAMNNRLLAYWSLLTGGTGATATPSQPGPTTTPAAPGTSSGAAPDTTGTQQRLYISPGQ